MAHRIVVINPNSTPAVTDGISNALDGLRFSDGPVVECMTLVEGPPAIETDEHVRDVVEPLCALMAAEQHRCDAMVLACYSDPGLAEARQRLDVPVFGISESAMSMALSLGRSFGVVSLFDGSVERHLHYVESLGLSSRMAADLPLDLGVLELADEARTFDRLTGVAENLRDEHGADVIVLGCTGMAPYRRRLEDIVGVPVVDPTQAAVTLAIGALT
ncbi:MAG: aspartate/glutamate racemase family protein [Actinomycetota bacterium]|jgi:Asp/Glu/hydantoin racemase|nr:aspartate/glutamate racemase family protein [Actinomycetota bacterium]